MKLAKTYEPGEYEPNIYAMWEASGAFEPKGEGEPYAIALPPPNANGNLHIGHALNLSLEDILIRYHRMKGRDTVFLPGADHAGFETWVVYEKELAKHHKSRFDFTREELYDQVWQFVAKQRGNMELQSRALGASLSWQHMTFTLDQKVIDTTYSTFKKMWRDGLVYRSEKIVNYCTQHQTSFADIEIAHKQEKTKLWHIAYQLTDDSGEIIAATSRPETKLDQSALVVHPDDERYRAFIGKSVYQPLIADKPIPVIGDAYVDPSFGTGAVTITPAHDPNDFEIAKRHHLPMVELIGRDGKITAAAPAQFVGYTVPEARRRIVAALDAANSLRKVEDYTHTINVCYKCGTTIEPLIMDQWFVKVKPLADRAIAAIGAGEVSFTPASRAEVLVKYFQQLRDWNISRQIIWGIGIPAFQNVDDHDDWIFDTRVDQPTIQVDGKTYQREEDTFDTWFSSGQWPFITTDYAQKGELAKFYPLSVMGTAGEILYAWVARMLMLGLYATDQVPFKHVYLHGLVLDEKGKKMSKSKGNVINPMEMIGKYGSDALRMGVVSARSANQNQAFASDKVVAGRNFANKLWNMARYVENKIGQTQPAGKIELTSIADHWIVSQLSEATEELDKNLANYRFAEATEIIYHTIWAVVADWYIEASKAQDNLPLLKWALETSLKLAHPFAPFVTETIWQTLKWDDSLLISAAWPKAYPDFNPIAAHEFEQLKELVSEVRFVASQLQDKKQSLLYGNDSLIEDNETLVAYLANLKEVRQVANPAGLRIAVRGREAWLDIDKKTLKKHHENLERRLEKIQAQIKTFEARLASQSYLKNAPKKIVEETRQQLKEQQQLESRLSSELRLI